VPLQGTTLMSGWPGAYAPGYIPVPLCGMKTLINEMPVSLSLAMPRYHSYWPKANPPPFFKGGRGDFCSRSHALRGNAAPTLRVHAEMNTEENRMPEIRPTSPRAADWHRGREASYLHSHAKHGNEMGGLRMCSARSQAGAWEPDQPDQHTVYASLIVYF